MTDPTTQMQCYFYAPTIEALETVRLHFVAQGFHVALHDVSTADWEHTYGSLAACAGTV